jgi:hypothetical protein
VREESDLVKIGSKDRDWFERAASTTQGSGNAPGAGRQQRSTRHISAHSAGIGKSHKRVIHLAPPEFSKCNILCLSRPVVPNARHKFAYIRNDSDSVFSGRRRLSIAG